MKKTEEQILIEETYRKSKSFECVSDRICVLEDFKDLTNSSSLPIGLKDRFLSVANKDIDLLVSSAIMTRR